MGEQESKPATTDETPSGVVVGGNRHARTSLRLSRTKVLIGLACMLVLAGGILYVTRPRVKLPASAGAASQQLYNQATTGSKGVVRDNLKQLQKYAGAAKTPQDRAAYNMAAAQTAVVAQNYTEAQKAAAAAEQEAPSADSAATLAYVYLAQGDTKAAITYFNLASERSPHTDGPDARSPRSVYASQAYNLEHNL